MQRLEFSRRLKHGNIKLGRQTKSLKRWTQDLLLRYLKIFVRPLQHAPKAKNVRWRHDLIVVTKAKLSLLIGKAREEESLLAFITSLSSDLGVWEGKKNRHCGCLSPQMTTIDVLIIVMPRKGLTFRVVVKLFLVLLRIFIWSWFSIKVWHSWHNLIREANNQRHEAIDTLKIG